MESIVHEMAATKYGLYVINDKVIALNDAGEDIGSGTEDVWRIMWKVKDGLAFYSRQFETEEKAEQERTWMYQWHTKRGGLGFILKEWGDDDDDE